MNTLRTPKTDALVATFTKNDLPGSNSALALIGLANTFEQERYGLLEALTRALVFIQNIQLEAHRDIETGELISRGGVADQARAAIAKAAL